MAKSMVGPRFLVVSLGNPLALSTSLHSAGHLVLKAVQRQLVGSQPPFTRARYGGKWCLASAGANYLLIQSPTLMNTCGRWVARAWRDTLTSNNISHTELGLVIVHDDLEEELGVVKIRKWDSSARGHNGVKSVNSSLRQADFPDSRWARICIGIGRPDARDQASVSDYVLRPIESGALSAINDRAAPAMIQALLGLDAAMTGSQHLE